MLCMVEERKCSLRNKVVDDMNFVYMVFSGLQAVLSIGKAVPQCFLSGLIYWCILSFQVTFLPWGFLRRALLYLSTLTLLLHLISQVNGVLSVGVFVLCRCFCAKFPFNIDTYLKGWVPDCSSRGGWDISLSICRQHSRSINRT